MSKHENNKAIQSKLKTFYEKIAAIQIDGCWYYTNPTGLTRKEKVLQMLAPSYQNVICDLGCGDGKLTAEIDSRIVIGIDISLTNVNKVRSRGLRSICADITNLPIKNECVDKIVCTEVIDHLPNPARLLDEVSRALVEGGEAIFSIPCCHQPPDRTILGIPEEEIRSLNYHELEKRYHVHGGDIHFFSEEEFQALVCDHGFVIESKDYTYGSVAKFRLAIRILNVVYKFVEKYCFNTLFLNKLMERVLIPLYSLCYKKENTKHHFIIKTRKVGRYERL